MQQNGEPDLERFIGEFSDLRCQSAGRNRDVPRADAEAPRRIDDPDRADQVAQVGERFTHSHENDIVDLFPARTLDCNDLIDNFVPAQISRKSFQAARAKFAAICAAHLRRDADREAIRFFAVKSRRGGN